MLSCQLDASSGPFTASASACWSDERGGIAELLHRLRVQTVEQCRAAFEPRGIIRGRCNDSGEHALDAHGVLTAKLAVVEVDVVHDLGELGECRIIELESTEQCLEGAAVALMRVLR